MRMLAAFIAGVLLSGGLVASWRAYEKPYCPTEDSCQIDYSHGHWTVTEQQP
jgi:hypothetical protein